MAIGEILDLGLSSPETAKPPPPVPEVLRIAEHGDGWGTATCTGADEICHWVSI